MITINQGEGFAFPKKPFKVELNYLNLHYITNWSEEPFQMGLLLWRDFFGMKKKNESQFVKTNSNFVNDRTTF